MSTVTDVILTFSVGEWFPDERLKAVNAFFGGHRGLTDVSRRGSGGKAHQCTIATGAFKGLDLAAFTAHIEGLKWEEPENVRLYVQLEREDHTHPWPLWAAGLPGPMLP